MPELGCSLRQTLFYNMIYIYIYIHARAGL